MRAWPPAFPAPAPKGSWAAATSWPSPAGRPRASRPPGCRSAAGRRYNDDSDGHVGNDINDGNDAYFEKRIRAPGAEMTGPAAEGRGRCGWAGRGPNPSHPDTPGG